MNAALYNRYCRYSDLHSLPVPLSPCVRRPHLSPPCGVARIAAAVTLSSARAPARSLLVGRSRVQAAACMPTLHGMASRSTVIGSTWVQTASYNASKRTKR
jgi:hypothetical protein